MKKRWRRGSKREKAKNMSTGKYDLQKGAQLRGFSQTEPKAGRGVLSSVRSRHYTVWGDLNQWAKKRTRQKGRQILRTRMIKNENAPAHSGE